MVNKYYEVRAHSMQLANVFSDDDGKYTNYTRDFKGKIDYVFYDFTKLQVVDKERLPEEAELAKEVALPNSQFPSDHVPLVCTFMLVEKDKGA
jgi:mRNA deadenylase 3'-5' endonuclease subunit Ccr4